MYLEGDIKKETDCSLSQVEPLDYGCCIITRKPHNFDKYFK